MCTGPGTFAIQAGHLTRGIPQVPSEGQGAEDTISGPCSDTLTIAVFETHFYSCLHTESFSINAVNTV